MNQHTEAPKRKVAQYLDGRKLAERRRQTGKTQAALADAVDTTQNRLAHWETDEGGPGIETVIALARELDCPPADLMHEEGRKNYGLLLEALEALKAA